MKFNVIRRQMQERLYEVNADTPEEACRQVAEGHEAHTDFWYSGQPTIYTLDLRTGEITHDYKEEE